MDQLIQALGTAIADLQAFRGVSSEYVGLPERIAKTKTELTATNEALKMAKAELRVATARLARTKDENVAKHKAELNDKQIHIRQLDVLIGEAHASVDQVQAQVRDRQAERHNVTTTISELKAKLGV